MMLEGFHFEVPEFVSPIITVVVIAFFFLKSKICMKKEAETTR
jgi:hypothetical protein